ncbi:S1 RNA-binding domain-containing protein, partial [Desulfofundulus sp.]|uniref:S1 RNA-binding domain-containing protein n=1 Tax=Desulfofundulus sp. TaxID=2282750 RepID=UPI003C7911EB
TRVGRRRAILDISGVPGVLEAREYDWGWTDDLSARLKVNETLSVLVLSVDREKERVTVSRRALLPDPWPGIEERYKVGDEIAGRVTGVEKYGIFVNLEPGIDALTPHMVRGYPMVGDYLYVRITGIDPEKRHIRARVIRRLNIAG